MHFNIITQKVKMSRGILNFFGIFLEIFIFPIEIFVFSVGKMQKSLTGSKKISPPGTGLRAGLSKVEDGEN